jgi:hypothetical protein
LNGRRICSPQPPPSPRPPGPPLTPNRTDHFAYAKCTLKRGEPGGSWGNGSLRCAGNPHPAHRLPPFPQSLNPMRLRRPLRRSGVVSARPDGRDLQAMRSLMTRYTQSLSALKREAACADFSLLTQPAINKGSSPLFFAILWFIYYRFSRCCFIFI